MFGFYLGAHRPNWIAKTNVPLFLTHSILSSVRTLPVATAPIAIDSNAFAMLKNHGVWRVAPHEYVEVVRRAAAVSRVDFAFPQDWPCSPLILKRTGLSVREHQRRTVDSYKLLCDIAPDLPWAPVLQGWTAGDFDECAELYEKEVRGWREKVVGLGSLVRPDSYPLVLAMIVSGFLDDGLRVHALGVKLKVLDVLHRISTTKIDGWLQKLSVDSMAWSLNARYNGGDRNSLDTALDWRSALLARFE
jgi:hypothetical protein